MSSFFQQPQPQTPWSQLGATATGGSTSTTGTLFGGFGTNTNQSLFPAAAPTNTAPTSTFGGGGFGTASTTPQSFFGQPQQQGSLFGATGLTVTQSTPSIFGGATTFGTNQGGSLFGSTQPQTTSSVGGTAPFRFGTQTAGGFGSGAGQQSNFGSTLSSSIFGSKQQPTAATGTFGLRPAMGGLFGPSTFPQSPFSGQQSLALQPGQQPQAAVDEQAAFHASIFACCKFADDRDAILANLNYIQACWGSGQGHYSQSLPPITYTDKNVYFRFQAVGYSCLYQDTNEDGQVIVNIRKPQTTVLEEETQFIGNLQAALARPHIVFKIMGSKALGENMTAIILIAEDQQTLRRILATELAQAMLQPQLKSTLDKLSIVDVCPKVRPSPAQLQAYLQLPPAGLDPRVWAKAQEDNPDPVNMIPIPLLGPSALKNRLDAQKKESEQHTERLKLMSDEVAHLQHRHANINAQMLQLRRNQVAIAHRLISGITRLQMIQRQGLPLLLEEEDLRKKFENLEKQLDSPKQFRGRLNEIMAHIRLHKTAIEEGRRPPKYEMEPKSLEQIKQFLNLQQECINHLVGTLKFDMGCIQQMGADMSEFQ